MTINSEVRTAGPYAGSGGTGPFTFAFEIFLATDLLVQTKKVSDGTIATLTNITDYAVTLNADQNNNPGGTITLTASLSSSYTLTMTSAVPNLQKTTITNNGGFFPKVINTALDRLTILAQQIGVKANRSIKFPVVDGTSLTTELPPAPQRALKAVVFDVSGNVTVSADNYNDQLAAVTTQATNAANSATAAATSATAAAASATAAASSATAASGSATAAASSASAASTSATNAATSATAAAASATTATTQASTATTQATNAAASATLASQWASLTSGIVAATDYSAKAWAIGGTSISDGAAKNWAQQTGADVTGAAANSRSAKSWAQEDLHGATLGGSAKDWAQSASLPDGTNKSAKSYASDASTSATGASGSATTATTQASNASTSATAAASSATAAATSATNASTSETNAATSATNAAASAAAAAASAAGISMKSSCRVATTAALTVTYLNGTLGVGATLTNAGTQAAISIDSVSLSINDRVLIKDQASGLQNGIYFVTTVGSGATNWVLTRATDYDQSSEIVEGTATIIEEGTTNTSHIFVMTHNGTITVGTTSIDWTSLTANATSANTLTTPRAIYGNNFDGSAALAQIIASTYGGTGNGFTKFTGPTTSEKTFTLPDASSTLLYSGGAGGTPSSLTLTNATGLPLSGHSNIAANTVVANATNGSAAPTAVALSASTILGMGASGNIAACTLGSGLLFSGAVLNLGGTYRTTSSADNLAATDNNGMIDFTGSTNRTFTATAAATLGNGWSCTVRNNSTANITIDPNGAETIDALTTILMYPGETRLIACTGSAFISFVLKGFSAKFAASGSFTVPPGYTSFIFDVWQGGGSGASRTTTGNAAGGVGGVHLQLPVLASSLVAAGSTETITVGGTAAGVTGNTNGALPNNSTFTINGTTIFVPTTVALVATTAALSAATVTNSPASYASSAAYTNGLDSGGAGGDVNASNVPGGNSNGLTLASALGGGGGGACSSTAGGVRTGGVSIAAGSGGAGGANTGGNGTNGSVPGGGGGGAVQGGTSGSGAAGQIIIRGVV